MLPVKRPNCSSISHSVKWTRTNSTFSPSKTALRALECLVQFCPRTTETYSAISSVTKLTTSTRLLREFSVYSTNSVRIVAKLAAANRDRLTLEYLFTNEVFFNACKKKRILKSAFYAAICDAAADCGYVDLLEMARRDDKLELTQSVYRCLVRHGNVDLMREIIGNVYFGNRATSFTLVSAAATLGNMSMVEFLLERNAEPTTFAVKCARAKNHEEVAQYIERILHMRA